MPQKHSLILGTAGHIDHGKTSLVKALTGIDTDRLPEEKARGITIDLGFAALDLGDIRLGIVDVPGHERFIRNMLAGATCIDMALLVVAADDGVMPQTREHLEILDYVGVRRGVVAITKTDLVDADTLELLKLDTAALVHPVMPNVPIVATSIVGERGLPELKQRLHEQAVEIEESREQGAFHLAIDRVFVKQGHGTIVTGSVRSGVVHVDDEIDWHHDGEIENVRVRGLAHHNEAVTSVTAGQRAAINLAGVPHDSVRRGHDLAARGYLKPSRWVTVSLRISSDGRSLKNRLPVRVHLGTNEIIGTLLLLDRDSAKPGEWCQAQLILKEPVTAVHWQPFVIRDSSAETTLGGGRILDPLAAKLPRNHAETAAMVDHLQRGMPKHLAAAVWLAGLNGLAVSELPQRTRCPISQRFIDELSAEQTIIALPRPQPLLLHRDHLATLKQMIVTRLEREHAANPLLTGIDRNQFAQSFKAVNDTDRMNDLLDAMMREKTLVGDSKRIALASFKPKLTANQRKLKDKIVEAHRVAGFAPPEPASFANFAQGNAAALKDIYEVAVAEGLLAKVTNEIYLHIESHTRLKVIIAEKMIGAGATVAEIRDWLGTTRKYAVPLCEYLDCIGVTERRGDLRVLKVT